MNVGSVVTWVLANWSSVLAALAVLIGAASVFIKALEGLLSAMLTLFPSLQGADGKLKHVASWLDALSKAGWLNTLAATPKRE